MKARRTVTECRRQLALSNLRYEADRLAYQRKCLQRELAAHLASPGGGWQTDTGRELNGRIREIQREWNQVLDRIAEMRTST